MELIWQVMLYTFIKIDFFFFFLEKGFSFHLSWEDAALPAGRHAGIRGWRQVTVCLKYSSEQV